jgi:hypothetical protein
MSAETAALAGGPAADGSHTVIVLKTSDADPVAAEATARVQGELGAAGFHVVVLPVAADSASSKVKTAGTDLGAAGAFAILVHQEQGARVAEIWVSDRIRQVTVLESARMTAGDHERESEVLAVRSVELLRASLAELWLPREVPLPPPPPVSAAAPAPVPQEAPRHEARARPAFASGIGIGVGAGLMDSFGGTGPIWVPSLTLTYGWETGLSVQLAFRGLGPVIELGTSVGTAKVEPQFASVDVVKTWWPRARVVPFAVVGLGAQHVRVSGTAVPPFEGMTSDVWSPWTSAGLGAGVPLYSGLSLVLESRAAAAWPPTAVRIAGVDVGHVGAPSLLADAYLLGVFP